MTINSESYNTLFAVHDDVDRKFLHRLEATCPESYLKVYLKDNSVSECPRTTLRPRITQGDQFAGAPKPKPDTHRQSGVVFTSGLIRATGDRVTVREFCKARGLAPTLHLVIPSASPDSAAVAVAPTSSATNVEQQANGNKKSARSLLPTFALTLASPTTYPHSPIHYPTSIQRSFTRLSYFKEADRALRHMRIPYLPQYCAHTLRPYVPPTKCALCEIQILACETWWNSRNPNHPSPKHHHDDSDSMATAAGLKRRLLRVPQVLPADCTLTTRSIYYALGLPLGELDESCIDWDVVDAIMFIPSRAPRRLLGRQLPGRAFRDSSPSSSSSRSRIRVLFRRARRFFSTL